MSSQQILIIDQKISQEQLKRICDLWFGDMVKLVVDIENEIIALGGELHPDAEELLIQQGSSHENLWGANFYPRHFPEQRIDYTALINIRPKQDNPSMEILDADTKLRIKRIVEQLILSPDESLV